MTKKLLGLYLPQELIDDIWSIAKQQKIRKSELIENILSVYLAKGHDEFISEIIGLSDQLEALKKIDTKKLSQIINLASLEKRSREAKNDY